MKLLLDQNLSPRLVTILSAVYPGSTHVRTVGLHAADDDRVWTYAAEQGFVIVSKDADFHQRSFGALGIGDYHQAAHDVVEQLVEALATPV